MLNMYFKHKRNNKKCCMRCHIFWNFLTKKTTHSIKPKSGNKFNSRSAFTYPCVIYLDSMLSNGVSPTTWQHIINRYLFHCPVKSVATLFILQFLFLVYNIFFHYVQFKEGLYNLWSATLYIPRYTGLI